MTTKFDVGDKVAIIGKVECISIDDDGVAYCIEIENENAVFTSHFTEKQLRYFDEDDLK